MGWGLEFAVLLFRTEIENRMSEELKEILFRTDNSGRDMIIRMPEQFLNSEDLLSTLDFKNHILKTREGITVTNSEFVREKEIPRNFMFSRFLSDVKAGVITMNDFDEETNENFRMVIDLFKGLK